MKIRADEHVSKEIVRAVREMALSPGFEVTHVIETGDRGLSDVHWITKFASEGGKAILSADSDFHKRPHQIRAVQQTGMRVIHLPSAWANARCDLQAAHILLWWKRIEAKLLNMAERECYRPPWNIKEDGELAKLHIDFQRADKQLKRETARGSKADGKNNHGQKPQTH